uniref:Uncharacterized protein n=1 Tax=Heterorhabditis bacteriophora TaxID=37862 RepID=A0A1I7WUL9_HETBA
MLTVGAAADDSIVVESHYDKQVLDMEAEVKSELLDDDAYDTRVNQPSPFRRQPYIKRTRYSPYASGFILPYAPKHKNDEPEFIEIFQDGRGQSSTPFNGEDYEPVDDFRRCGTNRYLLVAELYKIISFFITGRC